MILWKRTPKRQREIGRSAKRGYMLMVNVNLPEGGSVTIGPSPGPDGNYDSGQLVHLASLPNLGYIFVDWGGDLVGWGEDLATPRSTATIIMDSDKSVTVNFRRR